MNRPSWIVFDAADTLIRPVPDVASVYQRVAAQHDVHRSIDSIAGRFSKAFTKHFDGNAGEELDRARWRSVVLEVLETDHVVIFEDLWDHFANPSSWQLFDDVIPTWTGLANAGFQLAIASNFDRRLIEIVKATQPICDAAHVCISSDFGFAKPRIEFFNAVEDRLSATGESLLMVGDNRQADYLGARNAGWQARHLDRNAPAKDEDTIATLTELLELLA